MCVSDKMEQHQPTTTTNSGQEARTTTKTATATTTTHSEAEGETGIVVREAEERDCGFILSLIHELAVFENEPQQVQMTEQQLRRDGFGAQRRFHALIGELHGEPVAYALYFYIYSTWVGLSLYLEGKLLLSLLLCVVEVMCTV